MIEEFDDNFESISKKIKELMPDHHAVKGYKNYTEYNHEHEVMGAAMVFKIK